MKYDVLLSKPALKALEKIPGPDRERIVRALRDLQTEPRPAGCKKLTGREAWRIRTGNYRILYEIDDSQLRILVIALGHRKEIYRRS